MKAIRAAVNRDPSLREKFLESTEKPITLMKNLFSRLERKGQKVILDTKYRKKYLKKK